MLDRPVHPDDDLCWALERALRFPKLKRVALSRLRKAERGHYYACGVRDAVEIFLQLYGDESTAVDWTDVIERILEPLTELGMAVEVAYTGRLAELSLPARPFGIRLTGSRAVFEAFASGNCPHGICWRQQHCEGCWRLQSPEYLKKPPAKPANR